MIQTLSWYLKEKEMCFVSSLIISVSSSIISHCVFGLGFKITCHGNPGHGSRLLENTAAEKLVNQDKKINLLLLRCFFH